MKATEKLQEWYNTERAAGRVVDIKFFPLLPEEIDSISNKEEWLEKTAQQVLDIVTGVIPSIDVTDEIL